MFKRLTILIIILLALLSCAKKSTEWNPKHVLQLSWAVPMVGNPLDLDVTDSLLYVAEDQGGLSVIKLSDYSKKWLTGLASVGGDNVPLIKVRKVSAISSLNRLFINETDGTDLIRIVNTADPDSLRILDNITGATQDIQDMQFQPITDPGSAFTFEGFFCAGRNVSYGKYGQHVPGLPSFFAITDTYEPPASANGAFLGSQYVYVAAEQRGLLIYNRATRTLVGEADLPGEAQKVKVVGNHAYVACRQDGLQIVDVSNPAAPVRIGSYNTTGYATHVDVWNNYAIVSSGGGGVYLFDVSVPSNPVLKDNITDCGYANNVRFHGGKALVASRDKGMLFYNIIP